MQIQEFIPLFKQKIDQMLDENIIMSSKRQEILNPGDWTFLFNCAVYDIVKEYNKAHKAHLAVCAEPEVSKSPAGRGAYSDMLICSNDGKEEFIVIEHENDPHEKIPKLVQKLSTFKAKNKLIITYYDDDFQKTRIMRELQEAAKKYTINDEIIHALISHCETNGGDDYIYEQIKTGAIA